MRFRNSTITSSTIDLGNVIDIPLTYYKDLILYNTDKIASYEFSDVPAFFDVSGLQPAA